MQTNVNLWYLVQLFLEWEMFQKKVIEKVKKKNLCSLNFFPPENRAVCEVICKIIVEPGRPQVTVWRMRILCWTPKTTNTHS
jgi:hypothetical protein